MTLRMIGCSVLHMTTQQGFSADLARFSMMFEKAGAVIEIGDGSFI